MQTVEAPPPDAALDRVEDIRTATTASQPLSQIAKVATGIAGFDAISAGGLPIGRTTLLLGGPGSGKTVFALQSLVNGAEKMTEAGIFVACEENAQQIVANAATFGWDLPHLVEKKLFFLDARISPDTVMTGDYDLAGMLSMLQSKAEQINARRIVFDGIDVLLGLIDEPAAVRREVYRIRDWLSANGLSAILTQKMGDADAVQRYGFLQFMVDCVIVLRHEVHEGSASRNLRIVKYRGSSFRGDAFPITLTARGVELSNRSQNIRRVRLELEQATAFARLEQLQMEIEDRAAAIELLRQETDAANVNDELLQRDVRRTRADAATEAGSANGANPSQDT